MIKFGPSGNSDAFRAAGFSESVNSPAWVKNMGLDLFEYSFGRGVNLTEQKAQVIGQAFLKENIELSVHAPYFINFAGTDEEKVSNSYRYLLDSLKYAQIMGAKRVVFHPASQGKLEREKAVNLTKKRLSILADRIIDCGYQDMIICPETMGKLGQIGTAEEIAEFCTIAPFYIPCIDFGHLNSRTQGGLKTVNDYLDVLNLFENKIGIEKLKLLHIHFSKIMYSLKGEVKHLTFEDEVYGPEFSPLADALKIKGIEPYIVSESAGTQDVDAKRMKDVYFSK